MFDLFKRKPAGTPADVEDRSRRGRRSGRRARRGRERLARRPGRSREKLSGALASAFSPPHARRRDAGGARDGAASPPTSALPATAHLLDDLKRAGRRAGGEARPARRCSRRRWPTCSRRWKARWSFPTRGRSSSCSPASTAPARRPRSASSPSTSRAQGLSVLLAAGDTFRAAAREQLAVWGERNNVAVIAQQGGDPAAVMFDAIAAATARGIDVVLADTAGRLPTQLHLMDEIRKVRRVIQKADARRAARDAAGARCQHRPERAGAGEGLRRGAER